MCISLPSSNSTVPLLHSVPSSNMRFTCAEQLCASNGASSPPSVYVRTMVMRFCVSVPVLSEQITEALPSVSTAGRRRMMAFFFTMRVTPSESTTVTMAGKPSGLRQVRR